jgi:hypothetical protein
MRFESGRCYERCAEVEAAGAAEVVGVVEAVEVVVVVLASGGG